ncbi:type 1 periplasmic binding fold superfamily protein [Aquimarina sp. MMG016]|uniref:type 1 periplasmic binding fold superfamily protein n=1 Tax=Aquimarina sp. MMG016 TaxID=2822690 RepID=UPI001B3A37C1|nr:type 1 periplasmic binding fold superfamily protein [Aquimarina sp. MMG016]MBQ4819854.1 type 1 periplasmic binding fold superfamily protein [Aquimarina sp. MMG016]
MKTMINKLAFIFSIAFIFVSCGDDDENPIVINEEETITTVKLTVTESGTTNSQVYDWTTDSKDDITLASNTSYNIKIQFLDESDPSNVEDITEEVILEKDEHFVFYQTTVNGLTFTSASDDTVDSGNISINISTDWSSTGAATGVIRAFLIHEPTTKTGNDRDDFGGETDIEVDFNVSVVDPV